MKKLMYSTGWPEGGAKKSYEQHVSSFLAVILIHHSLCFSRFDKASQAATCSSKNVETQRHTPPEKSIDEVFQDIVCEKADVFHFHSHNTLMQSTSKKSFEKRQSKFVENPNTFTRHRIKLSHNRLCSHFLNVKF